MQIGLDANRSEIVFEDHKGSYTPAQATIEANRCIYCSDAPCVQACPTHIEIPEFIRKIATGNLKGSARTIYEANILGQSCARACPVEVLCVGDCVYNELGVPPIQIGKLQRFATDAAVARGDRFFEAGPDSGKRVALIGGGPASLACAHELRRSGHRCTIFEKRAVMGGLNTTGIAPHKLKADVSVEEVAWILGIGGIDVRTSVEVGKDVSLEALEREHDAVFFGAGLGADTRLGVPGEDLAGVEGAVAWIERMKLKRLSLEAVRRCVVVGGGNTALDVVREARTLGVREVTLVYRGTEAGMPGYEHEWKAALPQGVRAEFQTLPIAFEGEGEGDARRVTHVKCARLDEHKRPIPGHEVTLEADLVLLAIGQSKLGELLAGLAGIELVKGVVVTDAHGRTGRAKWFAGGDARNGGKEVVNAAAEGKAAAQAIHAFLAGVDHA